MTRRRRVVAALSLLLLLPLAPACDDASASRGDASSVAPDPDYRAPRGDLLGRPVDSDTDCALMGTLLDNIRNTPSGALIRIAAFTFTRDDVAQALVAAHRRGVRVQMFIDARFHRDRDTPDQLEEEVGGDRHADSFLIRIHGTARGPGPQGFTHQKTWMFSRTGRSRWVTMVGSENIDHACPIEYDDMYSFVGRRDIFRAYSSVYREQIRDRPVTDPARHFDLGDVQAWFYPGYTPENEPVGRLLDSLPAASSTRVRILTLSMFGDRAEHITGRLVELARGGARVQVIARRIGAPTVQALAGVGIRVHGGQIGDRYTHNKLTLVSYIDAAGRRRRIISTGSDNLTVGSLMRDEDVVQIQADHGVARRSWKRYQAYYDSVLAASRRGGGYSR